MNKFKRIILGLGLGFMLFGLTGCSVKSVQLVNPDQTLLEVAERNIQVLDTLHNKGVLSTYQYNILCTSIRNRANSWVKVIEGSSSVTTSGSSKKSDSSISIEDYTATIKMLQSALVARVGRGDNWVYGIASGGNKADCDDETHSYEEPVKGINSTYYTPKDWQYLIKGETDFEMRPIEERDTTVGVQPLTLLDESQIEPLMTELNRKVYILDPSKFTTEKDWSDLLEKLNYIKSINDSNLSAESIEKDTQYVQFRSIVQQYFKDSGYNLYEYTADDVLTNSTDNSANLGLVDKDVNAINKDVIVSGVVPVQHHYQKEKVVDPTTNKTEKVCVDEFYTVNMGVYSFRVREFDKEFADSVVMDKSTNNKYIALESTDSSFASVYLLMEYPVSVLDSISSVSGDSPDWTMNFTTSDMKVNIYNGEMLATVNGETVTINEGSSAEDRIYRVMPENIGVSTEKGKNSSFLPYGNAQLNVEDVTEEEVEYDAVKLLSVKQDTDAFLDDYGFKLQTPYPREFLTKTGINYAASSSGSSDTIYYEFTKKNDKNTTLRVQSNVYRESSSTIKSYFKNVTTFTSLWTAFGKFNNNVVKKEYSQSKLNINDWAVYQIYLKLKDAGKASGDSKVSDYFSDAFIYWSLVNYLDTSNYSFNKLGSTYDMFLYGLLTDWESFEYENNDDENSYTTNYTPYKQQFSSTKAENIKSVFSDLGCLDLVNKITAYDSKADILVSQISVPYIDYFEKAGDDVDPYIGRQIDLTDANRSDLSLNDSTQAWEFKYYNKTYICSRLKKSTTDTTTSYHAIDTDDLQTVGFVLRDYLELTYMPGVISADAALSAEEEKYIATGRRITITTFSGSGDISCGYYADKYGDEIVLNEDDGTKIDVKVSDIIDYTSGSDDYFESIAKALSFNGLKNSDEVTEELGNQSMSSLSSVFKKVEEDTEGTADTDDTGMLTDSTLLSYNVYYTTINPVIPFTSSGSDTVPPLDSMDVGNDEISPARYFGLCVNTHAYKTGLYTMWIDVNGSGGNIGSLNWWNNWLGNHKYKYSINIDTLKKRMNGVYSVSLADLDNTIIVDADTIRVINKEMTEEKNTETNDLLRTCTLLLGVFFVIYGLLMLSCWLIDVNLVNGPGLLTIVTFGKYVSIRDASEIPRMSDGKIYVDFKYLFVVMFVLMAMGIILITFDIRVIMDFIHNYFRIIVNKFKNLMLNK